MKKFIVAVAMAALAVPAFAQNAPARVAVVDVQKVLTQSTPGKAAYERLKKMQDERIAKAKQMDDELKKLDQDITAKRVSLSEDKLAEMAKQLNDKKIAMQRYAQDADREIGEARDRELQALQTKIEPVIDAIGKEMGLALIFNKFESGLVYAADAVDITDTVVKRFNDATGTPAAAAVKK
ncbi:MAG TPA: OmpH family outer membrane protein [Thermoanaerobaculia bacterium]|nr:OmpH family outer membrane protein [Thermoanaerobaculia bacterium]